MNKKSRWSRQVGALPIDVGKNGDVYVLLVTSRETKRWVIPKGWPSRRLSDAKAAEREAREEAGVTGKIYRKPIGSYVYKKVLPETTRLIDVTVYALWVKKERKHWPEQQERVRIWTTLEEAAKLVREPDLQRLFRYLSEQIHDLSGDQAVEKVGGLSK